jgi:hypothetical protein
LHSVTGARKDHCAGKVFGWNEKMRDE